MGPLLTALGLVFVAELADKTQLLAVGFGARHRLAPVLIGASIGYAATNLVSVTAGAVLGATLPTRALGLAGGFLFVAFAVWTLRSADEADAEVETSGRRIVLSVAVAMFVAELGDKTMLATATLAAQGDPVLVWIGATVGIILSGTMGILLGRWTGAQLPERALRIGSATLFAAFGVGLLVASW